jgi:hypothetical protein
MRRDVPLAAHPRCVREADDSRPSGAYGDAMTAITHIARRHRAARGARLTAPVAA